MAREGIEQATSRALAAELGVATGSLWHYFASFDAVLAEAAGEVVRRTDERIDRGARGRRGLALLEALLHEMLPLEAETRDEAHVVVAFWGRIAARRVALRPDGTGDWDELMRRALAEAVEDGELVAGTPVALVLELLRAVVNAQQVAEVLAPEGLPAAAHRRVAEACIAPWRTAALD